jgi:hypothetical protein
MNECTRALNECARRGVAIDVAIDVDVVRRSRSRSRSRRARVRRTLAVDAPRAIECRMAPSKRVGGNSEPAASTRTRREDARTRAAPTRGTTTARSRDLVKR